MWTTDKQLDFCLLIPCYNNTEGLILSLKTVAYNPDKFLVVVVDDGSAVPVTVTAIKSEVNIDYHVIILRNDVNKGIAYALNVGLEWIERNANPKYIARLDCGDLCESQRFYRQVEYMNNHPDTSLLGSWCVFENTKNAFRYTYRTPIYHHQIKRAMHFRNVFIHPTVIFNALVLEKTGYYPLNFTHAEDYAFFWKLMRQGTCHIIDECLVTCEINTEGISLKNRQKQLLARARVVAEYGTNPLWKLTGLLRIKVLHILPKKLVLRLKMLTNR